MAKFKTPEEKEAYWHSTSHIMADAVKRLFPKVKLAIGPAIDEGFYYDFDKEGGFTADDLAEIEKEIARIIKEKLDFKQVFKTRAEAKKILKDEPYKLELFNELEDEKISFFEHGKYMDMCIGPHVKNTGEIGVVKLLNTADAYWRGDSKRPILHRIYGISFPDKKLLDAYFRQKEEAEKRDHIKLGRALDLYTTHPAVGKGLPLFTPRGATMLRILKRWTEDEEMKRGYQFTETPVLSKTDLYKISGHLDHYRSHMFVFKTEDGEELALRPMTCPFQFLIYGRKPMSYRELPQRYAETSHLFRREQSGELHGLIRIWQFTLADAHIICRPDQLEEEFEGVLDLIQYILKSLGLTNYSYRFSKWDPKNKEKYIDNPKAWESSQKTMKKILDKNKLKYVEAEGEAAFYGPKLDVQMKNVWGKEDTFFTIQIDFALPERFDLTYVDEKGNKVRPMIVHRASIGCYERTLAALIEHYAGAFPLWFSPVQVAILTFTDRNKDFAEKVAKQLREEGIRIETDYRSATVQAKIRDAEVSKINYIVVIGDKEEEKSTLAVRPRGQKPKFGVKLEDFISDLKKEIEDKK